MKTYKENSFYVGMSGNTYNPSDYSKIIKTSENTIKINSGKVAIYLPINTEVEFGDDEVTEVGAGSSFGIEVISGPFFCPTYIIPSVENLEITESTSVYVKIRFSAESGPGSYVDFGFEDGSPLPYEGDDTSPSYFHYGMLSRKTYTISTTDFSYELGVDLQDSDEETPDGEGYTGYFYVKIADIEKTATSFRIKQYHFGTIDITPPVILYDAYSITV